MALKTPLGKDQLLITELSGGEYISNLFHFELTVLSENHQLKPNELIGQAVTVSIQDAMGRHFNGYVNAIRLGDILNTGKGAGLRQYRLTVVPWLWFLSKRVNCRIFQEKSAVDVIQDIFKESKPLADFKVKLSGSYPKREYCVQFNESDFEFVTRLMQEEGIAYYFEHADGKHTMVLVDKKNAYQDCKEAKVEYTRGELEQTHVNQWDHRYEFRSGKWSLTDYNFETPKTSLLNSAPSVVDLSSNKNHEQYYYPGGFDNAGDGKRITDARMIGEEVAYDVISAAGNCSSFFAGGVFEISRHESKQEMGKFIITSIRHFAIDDSFNTEGEVITGYSNSFQCIPDSVHFRPPVTMPKPVMRGPQTALVVGDSGEEIHIDKYARIKVQFYWDREGRKDAASSCWIRVATSFAGNKWGGQFIPRIGQELVVSFLDGDPDRPLVTGAVYNADNMPPYSTKTQSGIKTHSTVGGGASNYNELRFEDKKGSEEIHMQAEKDYTRLVKNDEKSEIKANHYMTVTKASETKAKSVLIEAKDFIELKCGSSNIKMTPSDITIKTGGSSIKLDAASITEKSTKIEVNGSALTVVKGGLVKVN